jgi:hypothetical protein
MRLPFFSPRPLSASRAKVKAKRSHEIKCFLLVILKWESSNGGEKQRKKSLFLPQGMRQCWRRTKWRVNELRRGGKGAKESNIKARAYIRLYYNLSFWLNLFAILFANTSLRRFWQTLSLFERLSQQEKEYQIHLTVAGQLCVKTEAKTVKLISWIFNFYDFSSWKLIESFWA